MSFWSNLTFGFAAALLLGGLPQAESVMYNVKMFGVGGHRGVMPERETERERLARLSPLVDWGYVTRQNSSKLL